ncbi:MAG: histone deacetylase family protein [Bacillota bacterium]
MSKDKNKIGVVYHKDYLIHTQGHHPERKERLEHIIGAIEKHFPADSLVKIDPVSAKVEDIALIHDPGYIRTIEEACNSGQRNLDMDTYIVPESYRVALLSAGGVLSGLREVMGSGSDKIFALNRPPGHHAEKGKAMGFCLFNNIAVTAEVAKRDYGLKRIAIIDWDVHHGNGTQHSFEADPEVLFISTHQSPAYPGTGHLKDVGRGTGEGYTVNVPMPPGSGDAEYAIIFEQVIIPILDQFQPELILISSGHDAYRHDPLAGMSLTHQGFYNMADSLRQVAERHCQGRVLLCLEGGYHLEGQAGAVIQVINALGELGLPVTERSPDLEPTGQAQARLEEALQVQRKYWSI